MMEIVIMTTNAKVDYHHILDIVIMTSDSQIFYQNGIPNDFAISYYCVIMTLYYQFCHVLTHYDLVIVTLYPQVAHFLTYF